MTQTVLVTGGAGYIGSHVCWKLHLAGYRPVVLDNMSAGHEWAVQWGDLVRGDIGDAVLVRDLCAQHNPVAVLHFAALTDVAWSVRDPDAFFDNNVARAERLFHAAAEAGVKHFVFSSTAAVYGVPGPDGSVDEDTPLNPANPYGESKIRAEKILRGLDTRGVTSMTLRYFNVAGAAPADVGIGEAHWPETNLLPRVILSALGYEGPLSIFGNDYDTPDGTGIRDYIHVCDLADAHIAALDYLIKGGSSDVCNLGTGHGYSVKQIVDTVERHLDTAVTIHTAPRRPGDIAIMLARADKAARLLNWTPRHDLDAIVASACAWHSGIFYKNAVDRMIDEYGKREKMVRP